MIIFVQLKNIEIMGEIIILLFRIAWQMVAPLFFLWLLAYTFGDMPWVIVLVIVLVILYFLLQPYKK